METFCPIGNIGRGFDFNGDFGIAKGQIDFRTTGRSPEANGKIELAIMSVGPEFLKNEMFKRPAVFCSPGCKRGDRGTSINI